MFTLKNLARKGLSAFFFFPVFTILLEYRRTKDWTVAITAGMPVRHGYIPRKTASSDDSHTWQTNKILP